MPQIVSSRVQRWAVTLCAYDYAFVYRAGKEHGNAETLSHLPVSETEFHAEDKKHLQQNSFGST